MFWKFGLLAFIDWAIVSVVLSINIVVVRRLNPDTTRPPFADLFSNRQCPASTCTSRSTCAGGRCCMCQCLYDYPNVFVNRTSLRCTSYGETNRMSSANCHYSFRRPNEPLEVIPLTEIATGRIRFRNDSARVDCTEDNLSVDKWQYLDVNGRWENGDGNVFGVDFRIVNGLDGNKEDLTFLNWNAMLDAKYAGLIIKLSLSCAGSNVGCILAKINGTYTSASGEPGTSGAPITRSTPGTTQGSSRGLSPGTSGGTTPGRPSWGPPQGPSLEPSTITPGVTFVFGTNSGSTVKKTTQSVKEGQQASEARNTNKITVPALIAIVGLICLICLVCLIVVLYKRRKKRLLGQPAKEPEVAGSELDDNQDPIYAEPDDTQTSDNLLYCKYDPVEEQMQIMKRSRLDPLPSLPVDARALLAREV